MELRQYLDATLLKTAEQQGISVTEYQKQVAEFVREAIEAQYKLVMIRPDQVAAAVHQIQTAKSAVLVGTVIDFPLGQSDTPAKWAEAQQAIADGADELDFVADYQAFVRGEKTQVQAQIAQLTRKCLDAGKTVKWIIEIAALHPTEVVQLTSLIKKTVMDIAKESEYHRVFVKSSTGFYPTPKGVPNGATVPAIKAMLENAGPLPVKAAGGVRNAAEAIEMIQLGVQRIGTSAAKAIVAGQDNLEGY